MSGFIEGEDRQQVTLFPESLDEYIDEDNAVRVIDVFVDELDISGLGFKGEPNATGRPAYHPRTMLKLYVYGYLNRIQSSRRLEREAQRNVELMWLTGRLAPDFKTIANFRKDNGPAIRRVCREFIVLCRKLNLFTDAFVAIDGSKFKAVNNRDRNFTKAKMARRLQQIDESIERYLGQIASADRQDSPKSGGKAQRLSEKIRKLKREMSRLKQIERQMLDSPDKQVSLTDPDARSMNTRGTGMVGYNVQTAVDAKHHLIVAHEVSNDGGDRQQLENMSKQARDATGQTKMSVVADRGYYRSEDIRACELAGITTYLPKPQTSGSIKQGLFRKRDFIYHSQDDEYECPAGQRAIWRFDVFEKGRNLRKYWSSSCPECPQRAQCTTSQYRRLTRWQYESSLDALQTRLDNHPQSMTVRRSTVEHPFGTLKSWMGHTHFLTKRIHNVSTEMSLHVLAYNLKRMMSIMGGVKPLIQAIKAA